MLLQQRGRLLPVDPATWVWFPAGTDKVVSLYNNGAYRKITKPMTVMCINISVGLILRGSCAKKFGNEFQIVADVR